MSPEGEDGGWINQSPIRATIHTNGTTRASAAAAASAADKRKIMKKAAEICPSLLNSHTIAEAEAQKRVTLGGVPNKVVPVTLVS